MKTFPAKLESLGYAPARWQLPVTEEYLCAFERDYGLRLPAEYRAFVQECGGWVGDATCEFIEQPTPLGSGIWVGLFYGRMVPEYEVYDVRWATDSVAEAPRFVAVASGAANGCMVVIRCGGPDDGNVCFFDRDQRSLWADKEFRRMFPSLHPLIEEYLNRRRTGQLAAKPDGYESSYLLARGFNEFVAKLAPVDDG